MDNKIYIFTFSLDDEIFDTTIVVETSFEKAINIYKEKRIDDFIVQWTYSYGIFTDSEYDDDEDDDYDRFKKMWDLTTATFDEGTTTDLLNYRVYKFRGCTRITIIEFPKTDYNLISVYGYHNTLYDRINLINYSNDELAEIMHKMQPDVKRAREIESKLKDEDDIIDNLIEERSKIKTEMFNLDSNSEKYKSLKKRFMELRKEIEEHLGSYDELLLSYKEEE